jgi:hypothetical protein
VEVGKLSAKVRKEINKERERRKIERKRDKLIESVREKDQTRFVLFPLPQFNDDQQPNISLKIVKTHFLFSLIKLNFYKIHYFLLFNFY